MLKKPHLTISLTLKQIPQLGLKQLFKNTALIKFEKSL